MRKGKRIIVITGVPGTGKTSLSNLLKRKLHNAEVIHVTEIVKKKSLFSSHGKDGAKIVRMKRLKAELERLINESPMGTVILEGHILCDMKLNKAKAIVLREHLDVLKTRLAKRGYGIGKIRTNLVSEATDYCGTMAERNYDYVFETFARNRHVIRDILKIADGKAVRSSPINLMPELEKIIMREKVFAIG